MSHSCQSMPLAAVASRNIKLDNDMPVISRIPYLGAIGRELYTEDGVRVITRPE